MSRRSPQEWATTSASAVISWMRAEADNNALAFHEFYTSHDQFKTSDPVFRSMVTLLNSINKITTDEKTALLRLGERKQSRAEELFGRKITIEDF